MPEGVSAPIGQGVKVVEEKKGLAGVDLLGDQSAGVVERGGSGAGRARSNGRFEEYDLDREEVGGTEGEVKEAGGGEVPVSEVTPVVGPPEMTGVEVRRDEGDVPTSVADVEVIKVKRKRKKRVAEA